MNCSTLFTLFFNKIVGVDLVVAIYKKSFWRGDDCLCTCTLFLVRAAMHSSFLKFYIGLSYNDVYACTV